MPAWQLRRSSESHIRIFRDRLCDARGQESDRGTVISLAEDWHHLTAKAADFAVGQNRFQTVSNFHPILPVARGKQNQNASIVSLSAHSPSLEQIHCEVFNGPI